MAFDFKKITDVAMQAAVTEATNVYIEENGEIKRISADEFSGMPKLAEDGSDADKVLKANADGSGYELVEFNIAPTSDYTIAAEVVANSDGATVITLTSGSFDDVLNDAKNNRVPKAVIRYLNLSSDGTGYYAFGVYTCMYISDYGDFGYSEFNNVSNVDYRIPMNFVFNSNNTIEIPMES